MINLFLNDRYFNSLDELKEFFASTSIDAGSMLAQEIYERVYGQDLRGWLEERCPDQTQLIEAVKQIDSAPILPIVDLLNRVIALFTGVSGHVANPDFHDHAKLIGEPEKRLNESGDRFSSVKFIFQVFQPLNASYLLELKSQDGKMILASQTLSLDVGKGSPDVCVTFTNIPALFGLSLVVDDTKIYADHVYQIGDYYDDGKKQGVIFEVDASGQHGKIVSLQQSKLGLQWAFNAVYEKQIGAQNVTDGMANMNTLKQLPNWQINYPAFTWCASLGEGWYLPAIDELKCFTLNDEIRNAVNKTLATHNGDRIFNRGETEFYWASTEVNKNKFLAWSVYMYIGNIDESHKTYYGYARAIATF